MYLYDDCCLQKKLMVPNVVFQSVEYAGREHAYVILAVLREVHWGGIDH